MIYLKTLRFAYNFKRIQLNRSFSTYNWFVEHLNKRTVLKLSGSDTSNYIQSMITNDIRNIETFPAIFSFLLNSDGRVLYDILLYRLQLNEYLVDYESTAYEYLGQHLLMYRLRKDVKIQPLQIYSVWAIYPETEQNSNAYSTNLKTILDLLGGLEGVITCVTDPRTDLLGIRVITKKELDLLAAVRAQNKNTFLEGNSYRAYRYKLGIGEGVIDHPPGKVLPFDANVDFLNGISFSKGCYLGQEHTAKMQFHNSVRSRLMPVILEPRDTFPEFPPECNIINEKNRAMGRLRSHVGRYGLARLKVEDSLKSNCLVLKDFDIKLEVIQPKWWPDTVQSANT